ncbi:hypothetical protein ABTP77_22580, partial [Acinetobacter baumannii]
DRIYARISEVNPALARQSCGDCGGRNLAQIVAGALAQAEGVEVGMFLQRAQEEAARMLRNLSPS